MEMRQKIEEAFIPVLNRVRCLDKHVTGNIKLASMLVDALPTEVQAAIYGVQDEVCNNPMCNQTGRDWSDEQQKVLPVL